MCLLIGSEINNSLAFSYISSIIYHQQKESSMPVKITASWETLLDQASITSENYYNRAYRFLKEKHGVKFVAEHPEIVIEMAKMATADFYTSSLGVAISDVSEALREIKESL